MVTANKLLLDFVPATNSEASTGLPTLRFGLPQIAALCDDVGSWIRCKCDALVVFAQT